MFPQVKNCAVLECYYNESEYCHAEAIQVGSDHPLCDTYIRFKEQHGKPAQNGHVGACHQNDCKWNDILSCNAPSINVDYHDGHADCYTYEALPNVEKDVDVMISQQGQDITPEGSTAFRLSGQP